MRTVTIRTCYRVLTGLLLVMLGSALFPPLAAAQRDDPPVVGTWEWEISVGGIAGVTLTPATVGYTQQLEFTGDGVIRLYRDELLQFSGTYEYMGSATSGSLTTEGFDLGIEPIQVTFGSDVEGVFMDMVDSCCDGFQSRYRERGPIGPVPAMTSSWGVLKGVYGIR
jgi:hypothetical protein